MDDYIHWLDLGNGEVEFRPVESPWTPDPSNWRLTIHMEDTQSLCRKTSGDSAAPVDLIDIRSPAFHMLSHLLYVLESPEHIIITSTSEGLEAVLNRLRLAFFVNHNSELECRSMQGYVIDEFRSCGTMFGLKNKLVLRPSNKSSDMPRRVVIPQGEIKFRLDGDFTSVSIKTGSAEHVHWYEYTIDNDLGRLSGNVSLQSRLYQCYLHALTSHCLPDPLLGHTGTEESLNMLQSAAFLSFQRLSKDDAMLLHCIGDLTPKGVSSLSEPTVRIKWKRLPILSQHYDFDPVVLSIFTHADAMETFYDEPVFFPNSYRAESIPIRIVSRSKMYYPQDLQSSRPSSIPKDDVYKSRDTVNKYSAEFVAYQTSWSIWNNRPCLPRKRKRRDLWDIMEAWRSLGPPSEERFSLHYSRYWLNFDPAKDWLRIYELCQNALNADPQDTRITLAFSLSAARFGDHGGGTNYASIIPLILIFATDTRFRGLTPPSQTRYDLSVGVHPDRASLVQLMSRCALPLKQTPAQMMEIQATANENDAQVERQREYKRCISEEVSMAAQSTMERWPKIWCDLPHQWFDTQRCKETVRAHLELISLKSKFRDHILLLQAILTHYSSRSPPRQRYVYSPKCRATQSKAKIPSLRDVLASRRISPRPPTNEEPPSVSVTSSIETTAAKPDPPSTTGAGKEGGLSSLIEELRQSEELLLQLYGEDLGRSYAAMVAKGESSLVQRSVPSKVPPHEALLHYHDLCSKQKDAVFSQLSEALGPSQKLENVLSLSGLWPRITPRSILRQLSRDCVHTLSDQWKRAITRYAVAFLKYQQSRRLVELSSKRWDEELLREMDTVCEDVTAACSPDWLLIQVK